MQKALQRAKKAQRSVNTRRKKAQEWKMRNKDWESTQTWRRLARENNFNIKTERINRKIDWDAGLLAPRRDVGEHAQSYATLSVYNSTLPPKLERDKLKWWHLAEGDRVAVIRGREKGRIAVINSIDKDLNAVTLHETNQVDVKIPQWMREEREDMSDEVAPKTVPVPVEDVRLVYPLPDPATGEPVDVVIERLERIRLDGEDGRVVPGADMIIPWPEVLEGDKIEHEDDTPHDAMVDTTFTPVLMYPPLPLTVVDELRNKYSRTRTRHDFEYIDKLEVREEKEEKRKGLGQTMKTPLQELAEMRARQKAAEQRQLTKEQLAKIGETIILEKSGRTRPAKSMESAVS